MISVIVMTAPSFNGDVTMLKTTGERIAGAALGTTRPDALLEPIMVGSQELGPNAVGVLNVLDALFVINADLADEDNRREPLRLSLQDQIIQAIQMVHPELHFNVLLRFDLEQRRRVKPSRRPLSVDAHTVGLIEAEVQHLRDLLRREAGKLSA